MNEDIIIIIDPSSSSLNIIPLSKTTTEPATKTRTNRKAARCGRAELSVKQRRRVKQNPVVCQTQKGEIYIVFQRKRQYIHTQKHTNKNQSSMGNQSSTTADKFADSKPQTPPSSTTATTTTTRATSPTTRAMTPPAISEGTDMFASGILVDHPSSSTEQHHHPTMTSSIATTGSKKPKPRRIVKAAAPPPAIKTTTATTSAATTLGDSPVMVPSSSGGGPPDVTATDASKVSAAPQQQQAAAAVVDDNDDDDQDMKRSSTRRHNATLVQSPTMVARELQQESMEQHRQERFQSHMIESKNSRAREINSRRHGKLIGPYDNTNNESSSSSSGGGGRGGGSSSKNTTTASSTSNPFTRFWSSFRVDTGTHKRRRGGGNTHTKGRRGRGVVAVISPERDSSDFQNVVDEDDTDIAPAEKRLRSESTDSLEGRHGEEEYSSSSEEEESSSIFQTVEHWWEDYLGVTTRTGAAITAMAVTTIVVLTLTSVVQRRGRGK